MDDSFLIKIKKLILILCEEYNCEFSQERLVIWINMLKQFDIKKIESAVCECLSTSKFMPHVSELIAIINSAEKIIAQNAWGELLKCLARSESSDDLVTKEIVSMFGGAKYLASIDLRDLEFKRKTFLELYDSVSKTKKINNQIIQNRLEEIL